MKETDTPETDAEAWFDNDESWFVSRSVSRRMERGRNCALAQLAELREERRLIQNILVAAEGDNLIEVLKGAMARIAEIQCRPKDNL